MYCKRREAGDAAAATPASLVLRRVFGKAEQKKRQESTAALAMLAPYL